jgi:hypothetical protein
MALEDETLPNLGVGEVHKTRSTGDFAAAAGQDLARGQGLLNQGAGDIQRAAAAEDV